MNPGLPEKLPNTLTCRADDGFTSWLAGSGGALAITTYQAGKLVLVGWDGAEGQLRLLPRHFDKPMGLAVAGDRWALAARHAVWTFADAPQLAADYDPARFGRFDRLMLPRVKYLTGDLFLHDLAYDDAGLVLVNTRFSCLCRPSDRYAFEPIWRPRFVTELAPEDRCHLNGLAVVDGRPRYVTALGTTDAPGAWRADKATGGVVIDITTDEVVCTGLAMPHSPRRHDGHLFVLNSGAGQFGRVDLQAGRFEPIADVPGYARGLDLVGDVALVGLCKIREKHIFGGLPIQQRPGPRLCGVALVDWRRGAIRGLLEFTAGVEELFEVRFAAGARRPNILNEEREATREAFPFPEASYWLRPSSLIAPDPLEAEMRGSQP